ncbi:MAG: hypothetical protein ACKESA_00525 [Candidatus Hodgkinia cicadicola]
MFPFHSSEALSTIGFSLASPEAILSQSYGEVYNPSLYCFETGKPSVGGLFCPFVFGPPAPHECLCRVPALDARFVCVKCKTDLGLSYHDVRSRFGHINLAMPVVHTWFYKTDIRCLALLLGLSSSTVRGLINCDLHLVIKSPLNELLERPIITTKLFEELWNERQWHCVLSAGQAINELLAVADLQQIKQYSQCGSIGFEHKMKIIDSLICNNIDPTWIALKALPVLPGPLRPIVVLANGKQTSLGINILYRNVIIANNAIANMLSRERRGPPSNVLFNAKLSKYKQFQRAIDSLIGAVPAPKSMAFHRPGLKSLTELIKGKRGRFRHNLLGKRVDYSGRSVIAPGPSLQINECGVPMLMAIELFKPLVYSKLMLRMGTTLTKVAKAMLMSNMDLTKAMLVEAASFYPVILNRAPTLHKLSIRALKVKLTNEKVIRLHPLLCQGFNADFDGDQMAVHVPLSYEARIEAMNLIMPTDNVLCPSNGLVCVLPTQDMIMGLYYLSLVATHRHAVVLSDCMAVSSGLLNQKVHLHDVIKHNMLVGEQTSVDINDPRSCTDKWIDSCGMQHGIRC